MNGYSAKTEYFIFNNQPKLIQTKVGTALKKTQNCPCCTSRTPFNNVWYLSLRQI